MEAEADLLTAAELLVTKQAIAVDDERLRRALMAGGARPDGDGGGASAAQKLRQELSALDQERLVQVAQLQEMEAGNDLFGDVLDDLELRRADRRHASEGALTGVDGDLGDGSALAEHRDAVSAQLRQLMKHEQYLRTGLQEEKLQLQAELAGLEQVDLEPLLHELAAERSIGEATRQALSGEDVAEPFGALTSEAAVLHHGAKKVLMAVAQELDQQHPGSGSEPR